MTKIIIENDIVSNIPILSIYQSDLKQYPIVFHLHGYGGDREQALDYGYMLAQKGFYYVSFDCLDHGKRKLNNEHNQFSDVFPPDTGLDTYVHMHEVIEQTELDIQKLIEYYKARNEIDTNKIGLSGFSMGGYATFYIAANNPDIKVAAPIAGKPAFRKAWEDSILSTSTYEQWKEPIQKVENEIAKRTTYFQMLDPYEKMRNFASKPLLIINGDQDTDSLFTYSLELYKSLLPFYESNPDKLRLSMPFVVHQFNYQVKLEACNWFVKHLIIDELE